MDEIELENQDILEKKAQSFKTIYRAICAGKNLKGVYEDGFLFEFELRSVREYLKQIQKCCRIEKGKSGNVIMSAWILSQKYYDECHSNNDELFNEIYAFATNNINYINKFYSQYHAVKNSPKQGLWGRARGLFGSSQPHQSLTIESIKFRIDKDIIAWRIYYELAYPTLLGDLLPQHRL